MAYEDDEFDDECDFEVNKKLCFCKLPARPRVTFPNVYHEDAETAKQRKVPDSVGSVSETEPTLSGTLRDHGKQLFVVLFLEVLLRYLGPQLARSPALVCRAFHPWTN